MHSLSEQCRSGARSINITFQGTGGELEGIVDCPQSGIPLAAAVVCHPHPLYGGTMQNKVVHTMAKTFSARDLVTARFNFRGVGASHGEYDYGVGETADALAVVHKITALEPGLPVVVAGFSFGAFIALKLATEINADALITVAPPVRMFDFDKLESVDCPWLLVQGDEDELVDVNSVVNWVSTLASPPELRIVADCSHFFHGKLLELRDLCDEFLSSLDVLSKARGK